MIAETSRYADDRDGITRPLPDDPVLAAGARDLLIGWVASLHEHAVRLPDPLDARSWRDHMDARRDVLAAEELVRSPLNLVVTSAFSRPELDAVLFWARDMAAQVRTAGGLHLVLGANGLLRPGSTGVLLGLEDLGPVRSAQDVTALIEAGVRMAGVAYNHGSALGCGLAQHDTGLTAFGHATIGELERRGVVIDVAHAGDRTALETAEAASGPVVVSHVGSREVWDSPRMKPDAVLAAVAERGGVVGIEAAPGSTRVHTRRSGHTVDDVLDHVEHCAEVLGMGAVAIGADTFYGDHVGLYRALGSQPMRPPDAVPFSAPLVAGADNPSEVPVQLAFGLLARGWQPDDVAAVLGGNVRRLLAAVLEDAR